MSAADTLPSVVNSELEALLDDWRLMHAYIKCEAISTHYADGTLLAPQQREYAATVLTMLKHKEPTT